MRYNIANKDAAVREIKKYLYLISENLHPEIPRVSIDTKYDEETKEAVIAFQRIKDLDKSGNVDYETFTALYNDYSALIYDANTKNYILEEHGFPLELGMISEDVRILNLQINELSKTYSNLPQINSGNFYSSGTASAVEELRKIFIMPMGDHVDKRLYLRLKREINARRLSDEKFIY